MHQAAFLAVAVTDSLKLNITLPGNNSQSRTRLPSHRNDDPSALVGSNIGLGKPLKAQSIPNGPDKWSRACAVLISPGSYGRLEYRVTADAAHFSSPRSIVRSDEAESTISR